MPYKPRYTITDRILNKISLIMTSREAIEHSRLIPKWELSLRREARVHIARSSTSIEGNNLTLEQVKALAEHKEVIASHKDKQEVLNYLRSLDSIPSYASKPTLDLKLFLEIHKTLSKDALKDPKDCGCFRNRQVFVGKRIFDGTQFKEIVEYMPPDTGEVPRLVKEFLDWLNSEKAKKVNPVILAGIVHYEIARIHPFIDGNGRTARLMASMVLYQSGFDHRRFFALDDYYDQDRSSYYAALKTVEVNKGDLTAWLEYFVDGVLISVEKVKNAIEALGFYNQSIHGVQIELTERQMEILKVLRDRGRITNRDMRMLFKISRQAILKEVAKLIDLGLIEIVGKGRGAYYRILQDKGRK